MTARRASSVHQEAVARRLAQLSDELDAARSHTATAHALPALGAHAGDDTGDDVLGDGDTADGGGDGGGDADADWWSGHTRVAVRAPLVLVPPPAELLAPVRRSSPLVPPAPVPPGVPGVPGVPGRHASRRGAVVDLLAALVPDTLRGQVRLGPAQALVVVVLVALGLAVTAWWFVRGQASPPVPVATAAAPDLVGGAVGVPVGAAAVAPTPRASADTAPAVSTTAPPAAPVRLVVDVAGRVRHPGIVELAAGSRVVDALRRAGGARPGVDLTSLNLARPLVDGEQILVGTASYGADPADPAAPGASTAAPPAAATAGTATTPGALVDLNLATESELEALPDVGPVTAGSIIAWRSEHGAFTSVDELLEVDGIGDATLAKLTPLVTV